jgi:hypothetical protein
MKKYLKSIIALVMVWGCYCPSNLAQTRTSRLSEILFKTTGVNLQATSSIAKPVKLFQGAALSANSKNLVAKNLIGDNTNNLYGLEVNKKVSDSLILARPNLLVLQIPIGENAFVTLNLARVNLSEFKVVNSKGKDVTSTLANAVHYQGVFSGVDEPSVASISIFSDGSIMGMLSSTGLGNRIIGKSNVTPSSHVIYNVDDLKMTKEFAFNCSTDDREIQGLTQENVPDLLNNAGNSTCKDIKMYFECDNALYQAKGNTIQGVIQYMTGILNQVTTLYKNESINMIVSEIKVWDTLDPYASITSTSTLVSTFSNTLNGNFNGDIAHFVSGRLSTLGGGIANAIPARLCVNGKKEMCCVSAIETTYQPLPTYSWTVMVLTHEMGHILGSRHTHYCGWVGGPIDGCSGFAEADSSGNSCSVGSIPAVGGTIMSYCHQQSVGINMSLGFGSQPGNLLRAKIAAATCFSSGTTTSDPSNLQVLGTTGNAAQVQWDVISGATYYAIEYRVIGSSTWLFGGTVNTNSFVITGLSFNTTFEWRVRSSCSNFTQGANFSTPQAALQITINPQTPSTLCINSTISIDYTVAGSFNSGNVMSLRLINSSNNIVYTIGNTSSTISGSIQGTINNSIPSGTYRVRLDGSSPAISSLISTQLITISSTVAPSLPTITTSNYTDNGFDITAISSNVQSAVYYIIVGQGAPAPTAQQIIDGKAANGFQAIRAGSISITTPNSPILKNISGLLAGTNYDIYITILASTSNCPSSILKVTATTAGSLLTYCEPLLNCTSYSTLISNFKIPLAGLNNTSTCSGSTGFGFNNMNSYDLAIGNTYNFSLTTGIYAEYIYIWIDYNKDGTFTSNEQVYVSSGTYNNHTGAIQIPVSSVTGLTRMRVMATYSSYTPYSCMNNMAYGEAEDYLVNIGCVTTVAAPTNLQRTAIKANKATFSWNGSAASNTYQLRYKKLGNTTWDSTAVVVGATSITLETLFPNTTYQWEVGGGCSGYSAGTDFTTLVGQINIIPLANSNLCKGSSVNLYYSSILNTANTSLKVEMSNSSGSFTNTTTLGSTNTILASGGLISCVLPQTALGNYKIRIVTLPNIVISDTISISITNQNAKAVQQAIVSIIPEESLKLKFKASNTGVIYFVVMPFSTTVLPTYQQVKSGLDSYGNAAYIKDSLMISDSSRYFSIVRKFAYKGYYTLCSVVKDNNPCSQNVFVSPFYKPTGVLPGATNGYCTPSMSCETGYYVSNISIANTTLNLQKTAGCGLYTQYTSQTHNLSSATTYNVSVSSPNITYLTMWIDKNNNQIFESNEIIYQSTTNMLSHAATINTNNYAIGQYRMRVVIRVYGTVVDPCLSGYFGEAMDFILNVGNTNCWDYNFTTLVSPTDDVESNENIRRAAKGFDISNKVNANGRLMLDYQQAIDFTPGFDSQKTGVFSINQSANCPSVSTNSVIKNIEK